MGFFGKADAASYFLPRKEPFATPGYEGLERKRRARTGGLSNLFLKCCVKLKILL